MRTTIVFMTVVLIAGLAAVYILKCRKSATALKHAETKVQGDKAETKEAAPPT